MRWVFLQRAYGPHLTLWISAAVILAPGLSFGAGLVLIVLPLPVWYWSDLLTTGRGRNERLVSAQWDRGQETHPEVVTWLWMLLGSFLLVGLSSTSGKAGIVLLLYVVVDAIAFTIVLISMDAYRSFCQCVWPELEEQWEELRKQREQDDREEAAWQEREKAEARVQELREEARREAESYYEGHEDLLREVFPPALFRSHVHAALGDHVAPEKAWAACHALIGHLQPMVARERERRRTEEQSRRQTEQQQRKRQVQINNCEKQLQELLSSGAAPDVIEEEAAALRQQIKRLQEEEALRDTMTLEDL